MKSWEGVGLLKLWGGGNRVWDCGKLLGRRGNVKIWERGRRGNRAWDCETLGRGIGRGTVKLFGRAWGPLKLLGRE